MQPQPVPACWRDDIGRWHRMSNEALITEYKSMFKACFGHNPFCHNARTALGYIVDELSSREIHEYDNFPFGKIQVHKWHEW